MLSAKLNTLEARSCQEAASCLLCKDPGCGTCIFPSLSPWPFVICRCVPTDRALISKLQKVS